MSFHTTSRHAKHGLSLCLALCLFLVSLSLQAQESELIDPTPTDTVIAAESEAPAFTPPPVSPDTVTPDATIETSPVTPSVTTEATVEVSPVLPIVTEEPTVVTVTDAPATVTTATTTETPAALTLLYKATFDGSDAPGLTPTTGWTAVQISGGKALQSGASAGRVFYPPSLSVGAVEARFLINTGDAQMIWGMYQAALSADGTVTLTQFNNQTILASTSIELAPNTWNTLRLEVNASQVRVSVNAMLIIDQSVSMTPAAGQAGFAASKDAMLRIDDFAVYGVEQQSMSTGAPVIPTQTTILPSLSALPAPVPSYAEFAESGYPNFVWQPVTGAVSTTIEVNNVCGDGSPIFTTTTTNPNSYQMAEPDMRLLPGEYVYCLKSNDGQDSSAFSAPQPLKIAYNMLPADGEIVAPNTAISMSYYEFGTAANTYKILIDDEATFTAPVIHESAPIGYGTGSYTAPAIATEGTYFWRVVRLTNGIPDTVYSPVSFKFVVGTAGSAPTITAPLPVEGFLINAPVTFTWDASTTAPSFAPITSYQVHIATNSAYLDTVVKQTIPANGTLEYTWTPPANVNQRTFYVRVMGMNGDQRVTDSAWSIIFVDTAPPNAPVLIQPTENGTIYGKRPAFTWEVEDFFYTYVISLKDATTQALIVPTQNITTEFFKPSFDLTPGTYTFSLQAKDDLNVGAATVVNFTVAPLPVAPALTNLQMVPGNPTTQRWLVWDAVPDETYSYVYTYDIQVSTSSSFTTLAAQATNHESLSYQLVGLTPGNYYARVRGVNADGVTGAWNTISVNLSTVQVTPPTLGNVTSTESGRPLFEWTTTAHMTHQLEVNDVCGDGSPLYQYNAPVAYNSNKIPTTAARLLPGEYLFCLRAVNAQGHASLFSSKPFQVSYVKYQKLTSTPYRLSVYHVAPESGQTITYQVFIDNEPSMTAPYVYESGSITFTSVNQLNSHTLPTLAAGRYYVRVIRLINGTPEPVSAPVQADLLLGKDGTAPIVTSPAEYSIFNGPVTITWEKSTLQPTYGPITHYGINLSIPSTSSPAVSYLVPASDAPQFVFTPPANINNQRYRLQVYGLIDNYVVTAVTQTWFDMDNVVPNVPAIVWPTPNAVTNQPRPTFTWSTVSGATGYRIQILDATTQAELLNATGQSPYTSTVNLPNGSYIVKIRSEDNINASAWDTETFTVAEAVPPPVDLLLPAADTTMNIAQGLSWAPVVNASGGPFTYDVQVSSSTTFAPLFASVEGLTETSYLPDNTTPLATYYWRVRSVNAAGEAGVWSTGRRIVIDFVPPAVPVTREVTSSLATGRPPFQWTVVSEAAAHHIEVNNVCGDGSPTFTKRVLAPTAAYFMSDLPDAPLPQGDYQFCLRSEDRAGNLSAYSAPQAFTVLYNISPSNNVSSPSGYTFTWSSVTGLAGQTITYKVIVDSDDTFTAPWLYESPILSTTSHTVPVGLPTIYRVYWRVIRYVNGVADPILTPKSFGVTYTASVPLVVLAQPNYPAIVSDPAVTLAWNAPSPNLTHTDYRIEVYRGATTILDTTVPASQRQHTFTLPTLDNVKYEWRVTALNNGTRVSVPGWFWEFSFDNIPPAAPSITWPEPNTITNQPRPTFTWTAVSDAIRYTLQVINPQTQAVLLTTDVYNNSTLSAELPGNLMNGDYIVRVRSFDGLNDSVWTSVPFTIRDAVPPAVIGLQPANNKTMITAQGLTWQTSNDASGGPFTYDVQISANANFTSLVAGAFGLTTPTYQPSPFLTDGNYYWRVRAVNTSGVPGSWTIQSVTIDQTAPAAPINARAYLGVGSTDFTWTSITGATSYEIEVNDVCGDGSPIASKTSLSSGSTTSSTSISGLIQGDYQFCMRSIDAALNKSVYTLPRPFVVLYNVSPTGTAPVNGVTLTWYSPSLPAGQTVTYKILVDDESMLSLPLVYESDVLSGTSLSLLLPANVKFYWRVIRYINGVAEPVTTAQIYSFTNGRIDPTVPLIEPAANAAVNGPSVTLRWRQPTPTVTITGYKLEVYQGTTSVVSELLPATTQEYVLSVPANQANLPYQWRVTAFNGTQAVSSYNLFTPFTVDDVAPDAPTITAPTADAELSDREIIITWSEVTDAQGYDVEILDNAQTVVSSGQTAASTTTFTSAALLNGSYTARVRAKDAVNLSVWVTVPFNVNSAAPDPTPTPDPTETPYVVPAPMITSPAENAILTTGLPTITWTNPAGSPAVRYLVELNDVCGDGSPTYDSANDAAPITTNSYTLLASLPLIPQGTHQICVRAVDADGMMSDYSTRPVTYNVVNAPKGAYAYASVPLSLRINVDLAASNAQTAYVFQVDDEPTFTAPYKSEVTITSLSAITSRTFTNTLPGGKYYWRALRQQNGVRETPTSVVYGTFYSEPFAAAPISLAPATIRSTDPISWTAVMAPPPRTTVWGYVVKVASDYNLEMNLRTFYVEGQNTTSLVVPMPPNSQTSFYWTVAAIEADKSQISKWSTQVVQMIDDVAPGAAVILTPANGATLSTRRPLMQWVFTDTGLHDFALKDLTASTDVIAQQRSSAGVFTPSTDLAPGTYELRVRGVDAFAEGPWTTITFTIASPDAPLAAPTLLTPSEAARLVDEQPSFSWAVVSQALSYTLQIDEAADFASPLTITTTATSHTPTQALALGSYYWRVKTLASAGTLSSDWSEARAVILETVSLSVPVLVAPQNAANIITQPTFSWGLIDGAQEYKLQIAQTADFAAPMLISVSGLSYTPDPALAVGTYYWRAAAVINGHQTEWSTARHVTIHPPVPTATLIAPANSSLLTLPLNATLMNVTFKWSAVSGANYTLQLAYDSSFATIENSCVTTSLTCTLVGLSAGRYVWRVLVNNAPFGESASFIVSPVAPRVISTSSPYNTQYLLPANRPNVKLTWTWGPGQMSAGGPFTYDLEVSPSATFETLTVSQTGLTDITFTTAALPDATYSWRVRAVNAYDVPGEWSTVSTFVVDSVPSFGTPVISSPAANAIVSSSRPSFSWSGSSGAHGYTLEINDVCGDNTPIHKSLPFTTPSYTLSTVYSALAQGSYVVCVTAFDKSDNILTSAPRAFTVSLSTKPLDGGFVAGSTAPKFEWSSASEPGSVVTYKIQIDPTGDFAGEDLLTSDPVSGTSLVWPTALPAGSYQWRVVRSVSSWTQVDTSLPRTLFIGELKAGPTLTSPDTGLVINTPLNLVWETATSDITIDEYEVVTSRSSIFSTADTVTQKVSADVLSSLFVPTAKQNRVTHYWRVRGLSQGLPVTNWSTGSFIVDTVPPSVPTIYNLSNNALLNTLRPSFNWGYVSGASYRLSILDAQTLEPVIPAQLLTTTSYTHASNLPQTNMILQIETTDGLNWSAASAVTFGIRLGTAPGQNALVPTNRPTFTWTAVPGATGYTLQVDNNIDFSSPVFTQGVTSPTYTPTVGQALAAGVYVWRVKVNGGDYPSGNASRTFIYGLSLKPLTPVVASSLTPTTPKTIFNANDSDSLIFSWKPVTPEPLRYQVDISTSAAFPTISTVSRTTLTPSLTVLGADLTGEGLKYWRIRGIYSEDTTGYGAWSDIKSFMLDRVAPLPPMLSTPNTLVTTARPTFMWAASVTATRYVLTVIDRNTNQPVTGLNAVITTASAYTLPTTQKALKQDTGLGYEWFVQSEDAAGNRSATSLTSRFTLAAMVSPASGQFVADSTPTFVWTGIAGPGAAPWRVEVMRDAAVIYTSPDLPATSSSFTLPNNAPLQPGRYTWRVSRPTEDTLPLTARPFYVVTSVLNVTPKLVSPASGQLVKGTAVLSWQPIPMTGTLADEFTGYEVQISPVITFPAASVTTYVTTETSLSLSDLTLADGLYYWRVTVVFAAESERSPTSLIRSFRFDTVAPGTPVLKSPVLNAVLTDTTPTLMWAAASGAPVEYIVQIENDPPSVSPIYSAVIKAPSLTHTLLNASALKNGKYIWRVLAKDAAGNVSVVTSGRPLTIAAP